jgi:hypothetical protein
VWWWCWMFEGCLMVEGCLWWRWRCVSGGEEGLETREDEDEKEQDDGADRSYHIHLGTASK